MNPRSRQLLRSERGMTLAFVAVGLGAFLTATTLAIDVGMFMTARTQAQNSADSGALAGATALVANSWTDRTPTGPAVQSTVNAAAANRVVGSAPSVRTSDVTFPNDPSGQPSRVHVTVYRTAARSNAIPTLMGTIFGLNTINISAAATGEASPANTIECVKPFMIPDKWIEHQDPGGWSVNSTFDMYDNRGRPIANPDEYHGDLTAPNYTGYNNDRDRGLLLTIRAGTGNNIYPTMYYSWSMPSAIGGDYYRDNIAGCNQTHLAPGYLMTQEPGDMTGPTGQGIDDLIALDSGAIWEPLPGCNCVKNSAYGVSPRVVPIPVYDPVYYAEGKHNGRNADFKLANWIGVFIVRRQGNQVEARITPIMGIIDTSMGPAPANAFPRAVRLVE